MLRVRNLRRWPFVVGLAVCSLGWLAFVLVATVYGWWRQPIAPTADAPAFAEAVVAKINAQRCGNAVFALIQAGKPVREYATSVGQPVDRDTLFQVASLSKWVSAWGVMTLVEAGKLDLDKPVATYLKLWKLPQSEFDNDAVTVRRLLSHTAGLTDGLGYGGFPPGRGAVARRLARSRLRCFSKRGWACARGYSSGNQMAILRWRLYAAPTNRRGSKW
jgi:CubicO group peptidase (beta-lactamase class C family)